MKKKRKKGKSRRHLKVIPGKGHHQKVERVAHLLETGTLPDLLRAKDLTQKILEYHWEFYSELAYQRKQIADEITKALNERATGPFSFSKWQRAVKYRYSLNPLSVLGSLRDPGGRFNIGEINSNYFPAFPALYLAKEKETTLGEILGNEPAENSKLSALDRALTKTDSITIVSVSGSLEKVFDLREAQALDRFIDLIKGFSISDAILKKARNVGEPIPVIIKDVDSLVKSILDPSWRIAPMRFDVPSNSQIFGQLISSAQIEGIVYPSAVDGKDCLAVFPRNFEATNSYVQLDDETPDPNVLKRLDAATWRQAEANSN